MILNATSHELYIASHLYEALDSDSLDDIDNAFMMSMSYADMMDSLGFKPSDQLRNDVIANYIKHKMNIRSD